MAALWVGVPIVVIAAWDVLIGLSGFMGPCANSERIAHLPVGALLEISSLAWCILAVIVRIGGASWRGSMFAMLPVGAVIVSGIWMRPESIALRVAALFALGGLLILIAIVSARGSGYSLRAQNAAK